KRSPIRTSTPGSIARAAKRTTSARGPLRRSSAPADSATSTSGPTPTAAASRPANRFSSAVGLEPRPQRRGFSLYFAPMTDRLASLHPAHIATVKERHDRALRESGYDHAVISGGALHGIFLDDMTYPFKVNPHFKSWVPVVDNPHCFIVYTPGSKPRLV